MLYEKICKVALPLYAFLSSPIYGSTYYVSSNPSANYQCPSDISSCHIYCDKEESKTSNIYNCDNAQNCYFHCDAWKCGQNAIINASNATILSVTETKHGEECMESASVTAPHEGSAYLSTNSWKGFKFMSVYAGSNTHEIIIDTTNGQDDGKNKEYESLNVYAATADYLRINIGTNLEWIYGTIECPIDSSYNGPDIAPCMIDATNGIITDTNITAPDGTPKNVYIEGCKTCNNVQLICDHIDVLNGAESGVSAYPFNTLSDCWWTSDPTSDPTIDPTIYPTRPTADPTVDPTYEPTFRPTLEPTFEPTFDPTLQPTISTEEPTTAPSATPTLHPSNAPSVVPSFAPSNAPTQPPSNAPSVVPSLSPSNAPSAPSAPPTLAPTMNPSNAPSVVPSLSPSNAPSAPPTLAPTYRPTRSPTNKPTNSPSKAPSSAPIDVPTFSPSFSPTNAPSSSPTMNPSNAPTYSPTKSPTISPTKAPSHAPTLAPSTAPSSAPTINPTFSPSFSPTIAPSASPTMNPTNPPTFRPTRSPTSRPTKAPSKPPSSAPTNVPTYPPTSAPSSSPTMNPSNAPSYPPTNAPSTSPSNAPSDAPTFPSINPTQFPSKSPLFSTEMPWIPSNVASSSDTVYIVLYIIIIIISILICLVLSLWTRDYYKKNVDFQMKVAHYKQHLVGLKRNVRASSEGRIKRVHQETGDIGEKTATRTLADLDAMDMGEVIEDDEMSVVRPSPMDSHEYHSFLNDDNKKDPFNELVLNLEGNGRIAGSVSDSEGLWTIPGRLKERDHIGKTPGGIEMVKIEEEQTDLVELQVSGLSGNTHGDLDVLPKEVGDENEKHERSEVEKVKVWMQTEVKLKEYTHLLITNGYNTMESLKGITFEHLGKIGVYKIGHRRVILKYVKKLND